MRHDLMIAAFDLDDTGLTVFCNDCGFSKYVGGEPGVRDLMDIQFTHDDDTSLESYDSI